PVDLAPADVPRGAEANGGLQGDRAAAPAGPGGGVGIKIAHATAAERLSVPYAPVKISDGCSRKCAFCAIPQFRGAFRDRTIDDVGAECRALVERGVREVSLVSQDTN